MEQEYITDCAKRRWPVLLFIFCFDVLSLVLRSIAKLITDPAAAVARELAPQLLNMAVLYTLVGLVNRRSRQGNPLAARQEEVVLCALMDAAVTFLLSSLTRDNAQDYVLVAFFLITTTTFLSLRWHVGALLLALPVVLATARAWHLLPDWMPGMVDGIVCVACWCTCAWQCFHTALTTQRCLRAYQPTHAARALL